VFKIRGLGFSGRKEVNKVDTVDKVYKGKAIKLSIARSRPLSHLSTPLTFQSISSSYFASLNPL
jgi:hypothetical protein